MTSYQFTSSSTHPIRRGCGGSYLVLPKDLPQASGGRIILLFFRRLKACSGPPSLHVIIYYLHYHCFINIANVPIPQRCFGLFPLHILTTPSCLPTPVKKSQPVGDYTLFMLAMLFRSAFGQFLVSSFHVYAEAKNFCTSLGFSDL